MMLLVLVATAQAGELDLTPGAGVFEYTGDETHPEPRMRVFYHAPADLSPETPIWFVIHGAGRNAAGYRDSWIAPIEDDDVLLLVPEFTKKRFPKSKNFNLGNIEDENGEIRPEAAWTYSIVERLFDRVRADLDLEATDYLIYGHSAGSQFVHRMLLFRSETRAKGVVLANAGWYTMPRSDIDFPYGLGRMSVDEKKLAEVFSLPVVVLLGDQDTDVDHPQLLRTAGALAQGPHRFARGQKFFETAKAEAAGLGIPFAWSLKIVEGVAHSNSGMAGAAAGLLRNGGRPAAEAGEGGH
ncbi:MAG: hypothetical protein WD490_02840 [Opitutales bacterium]